jgi:hypothetical protein
MDKTKFDEKTITEIIDKRDKFKSKSIKNDISEIIDKRDKFKSIENDISEIKNTLNKLVKYLFVFQNES